MNEIKQLKEDFMLFLYEKGHFDLEMMALFNIIFEILFNSMNRQPLLMK